MTITLALLVSWLIACGTYLVLQRTLTRVVMGIALLGHGSVLLLQTGGRPGTPAFVGPDGPTGTESSPVPQALALTAIVIGFAMTTFLLALAFRSWTGDESDDVQDDIEDRRVAKLAADSEGYYRPEEPFVDEYTEFEPVRADDEGRSP